MKILAIADAVDPALYDHFDPARWRDVDLVLSCGDLPAEYLEFLATMLSVPVFYVRGNHDRAYTATSPGGCENLGGRVVRFGGLVLAGVEGSAYYGGPELQYTEGQMRRKLWALRLRIRLAGRVDIVVSHSAPYLCPRRDCPRPAGMGLTCPLEPQERCPEPADQAHRGFHSLRDLVLQQRPRYLLHGHTHLGYQARQRQRRLGETLVVDCYRRYVLDLAAPDL